MQRPTRCRGIDVFANRSLANSTRRRTYAQLVADYLRTLKALDDGVGRVLRRVDDENTLVLYTSDHGYFLGEHQRTNQKSPSAVDASTRLTA